MLLIKTLLATLLISGSAFALPEAAPENAVENVVRNAAPAPEPVAEPAALDKRACKCAKVSNPGLYCGYCWFSSYDGYVIKSGRVDNHVYWCNKSGGCEDFGKRNSCANYAGPCDGRDS
ncbi:hypothetical protein yc1106_09624 [Curvularia clavata]|uniref:Uncharacterized protein n=1 Tax=Curvularia clavata TaxID=95742 RepID=A0A9Q8ZHL3_CURCL|nr:hypothetical protein yc1106_09624 [Curvularia clavata]